MEQCKYCEQPLRFFSHSHKEFEEQLYYGLKDMLEIMHRYYNVTITIVDVNAQSAKNLPFVAWTALMAMEHIGHAASNERNIWFEPIDYADKLTEAVLILAQWRKEVAVYNVPLCLIPESIHQFAQKSISDWKNKYLPECDHCSLKSKCCGFFATSQKFFKGIKPIL